MFGLISWTFPLESEQARVEEADAVSKAALAHFDGVVLNALRETESSLFAQRDTPMYVGVQTPLADLLATF